MQYEIRICLKGLYTSNNYVSTTYPGLLRKPSRDSHRLGIQTDETPESSEDELEQETSFTTFKPTQKGLVNPLYEAPSGVPSASSSDAEEHSVEDGLDAKAWEKYRNAKTTNER